MPIGIVSLLLITIGLCWCTLSPTYAVLFNQLDSRDTSKILNQLEQEHIPYRLQNHGNVILIDKNLVDKTRIKLMTEHLSLVGSVGFELFDKNDFGMTDFSQKINYQRALQGELERTISSLEEVHHARVHLVIPEHHLFDQNNDIPRAAVTLHLQNPLTSKQIQGIQQLIAASVPYLKTSEVTLVDQNGHPLTDAQQNTTEYHFGIKQAIEHYLSDKVTQMLIPIFPGHQVMVKIDVSLNYDELEREQVKPQQQGILTHEKETEQATRTKNAESKLNQAITREKSYEFGTEKEHFKRASGNIERLSISVIVPQNTNQQTIEKVQNLVKSVIGFHAQRGDTISIEALFTPSPTALIKKPRLPPTATNNIVTETSSPLILLGLLSMSTTVLALRYVKRRKQRRLLLIELTEWLNEHAE